MPTHRLLADEQFPDRVTDRLRANGHDVARVREFDVNKRGDGKSDAEILNAAREVAKATRSDLMIQSLVRSFRSEDFEQQCVIPVA